MRFLSRFNLIKKSHFQLIHAKKIPSDLMLINTNQGIEINKNIKNGTKDQTKPKRFLFYYRK